MANKIQLRRGLKADIPTGSAGEPLFVTDTRELYVGTGSGNVNMGGSHWYTGTAMSGTSTTTGAYSYSACPQVKLDDMYLNTTYGYVYACTTAGSGTTAKWTYKGSIRGATGATGATGAAGADGADGADGTESATVVLTSSGSISSAISSLPTNGGKIILREGTYTVSSALTCNKNVIIEGMGDGTIINCTSHAFLNNTSSGYRIELKNIKFNLTGTLTKAAPFISAYSDFGMSGCTVTASATTVTEQWTDYILTYANARITNSTFNITTKSTLPPSCCAIFGFTSGYDNTVTDCDITLMNGTASSYELNLHVTRGYNTISNSRITLAGANNGRLAYISDTKTTTVTGCYIDVTNSYGDINKENYGGVYNRGGVFTGNTVYYANGCHICFDRVSDNYFSGSGTLYFQTYGAVITGNRFINSAANSISSNSYTIFKNNALKYSCTVSSSTGAIVSDNVVNSDFT